MRYIYSLLIIQLLAIISLFGQTNDNILFKAMQDEMARSKNELILPASPAPYFIAYTVGENQYISVSSSLGALLSSKESSKERVNSVNLYVGDSSFSSDYSYSGNGISLTTLTNRDDNYDQLRTNFWRTSDLAYKLAVEVFNSKKNTIKTATLTEEEKALPDMLPLKKVEISIPVIPNFNLNKNSYEELSNKLSKEFVKYPQIVNSRIEIDGIETIYYFLSTEGTKIKEPVSYVSITIKGVIRNVKGQIIDDQETIYAQTFDKLPSQEELIKKVTLFAERLVALKNAATMDEYYLGPVLFEELAVAQILKENLVSPSGIISFRKPIQVMATVARVESASSQKDVKPLEERINKKVIDSRLSVTNRTDLNDFNGLPLLGSYGFDAQGVVPTKEVKLIENGILKTLLSSRIPTKRVKESTGSMRFGVRPRAVAVNLAPGTLVVSSPNGNSSQELKNELIKTAIEEGLDYAYIVRK